MRIQHNIMAMNAYRNYNTNTSALSKNLEKLSSGYKINRAGDDAAGLAISEKMRAQITGLNAAQKNVKDGISLVKTAEGAMQEIQDMLNRMDYLATQSANGTYDDPVDRMNLNKEMDALKSEINRIADSANFNGIKLLNGDRVDTAGTTNTFTSYEVKSKTNITLATSASCCQFHKAGVASQQAKFDVDLKQALAGVKASRAMAQGSIFSLKVTVGTNAAITVKFTVNASLASGAIIDFDKVTFKSIATKGGAGSVTGANAKASFTLSGIGSGGAKTTASFTVECNNGVLKFEMKASKSFKDFDANMSVSITASGGITMNVNGSANTGGNASGVVSYNCATQNVHNGVAKKGTQLAHVHFDVTSEASKFAVNGGVLTIGNVNVGFDTTSKGVSVNTVGIKDLLDADGNIDTADDDKMAELARRISVAAKDNTMFTVGVASDGKTISLEEKWRWNQDDATYDDEDDEFLDTVERINKFVTYGVDETKANTTTTTTEGKKGALVLQIGDTADEFNRLSVSIGNMHVSAMGQALDENGQNTGVGKSIADINIKSADSAKEAIDVIKNAINYVSSVRGDLGAVQNRLEHTANNLSVMAENIQDAESTIRDTDVAEEMMAYTKNNILVQSAQAMLAQANAVPQGVLQLLG